MGSIFQKQPFNYQYYVGQSNLVNERHDQIIATAPVTNANLHNNIVIPAKTIVQDGQILYIYAGGNAGAHAGTALVINCLLNGSIIFSTSTPAIAAGHGWEFWLRFCTTSKANAQSVLFAQFFTNFSQFGAAGATSLVIGTRNFLNPFGGAGQNFDLDNTISFQCTDGAGAETITQDITQVYVQ